jgi:hypothetical protein
MATDAWRGGVGRRRGVGRRHRPHGAVVEGAGGESSRWPERDGRRAGVEETGASHPNSVGSGSEASSSDESAKNRVGAGDANPSGQDRTATGVRTFGRQCCFLQKLHQTRIVGCLSLSPRQRLATVTAIACIDGSIGRAELGRR